MSPHQTAQEIVLRYVNVFKNTAFIGEMTEEVCDAIQAASNEELARRRERVASLEAALKAAHRDIAELELGEGAEFNGRFAMKRIEAALSGSTSALDAVVAEATRRITEERDILSNAYDRAVYDLGEIQETLAEVKTLAGAVAKVTEERDAAANLLADTLCELRNHDGHPYCQVGVQMDIPDAKDAEKHLAARDSRVKAEGAAAELDRFAAMESEKPMCEESSRHVTEYKMRAHYLRKLAAQAGEATNG